MLYHFFLLLILFLSLFSFFFFNDTATTEIYTLSLHDALPIYQLSRWPSKRSSPSMVDSVASSRSTSSGVRMKPRSWAAKVERSAIPIFVGDVRWATIGVGVSWKLSGGRPWSSAPLKVSK